MIPLQHGNVKEARYVFVSHKLSIHGFLTVCCSFIPNGMHMGEPAAGPIILKWIEELFSIEKSPKTVVMLPEEPAAGPGMLK